MSVKIDIHPILHRFTNGQEVVPVNGSTVGQCLEQLIARFPEIKERLFDKGGKLLSHVDVYVNGESAYPEELAKPVTGGDERPIRLIMAGG